MGVDDVAYPDIGVGLDALNQTLEAIRESLVSKKKLTQVKYPRAEQ
jgi:hypothetical protein